MCFGYTLVSMGIETATENRVYSITSERIVTLCWRAGITPTALGRRIRRDSATMSLKMNGLRKWSLDDIVRIAEALDTTAGYLLGETDDSRRPTHMKDGSTAHATEPSRVEPPTGIEPVTYSLRVNRSTD